MRCLPFLLCIAFCIFVMTSFKVVVTDGHSMEPTYTPGDIVLCFRSYGSPKQGDPVLIQHLGKWMVKRIQAVPGDLFTVNSLPEGSVQEGMTDYWRTADNFAIPENSYFVTGDNPPESNDSRYEAFGLVPEDQIWGTVLFIIKNR